MGRIISIDYGTKRTGIAATDPLQIIATGLDTVETTKIFDYLKAYIATEEVDCIVVGEPFYPDGTPSQLTPTIHRFVDKLKEKFPNIQIALHDESYTSEQAKEVILASGAKKKKRRDKSLVDKVSAVLILQDYLEERRNEEL